MSPIQQLTETWARQTCVENDSAFPKPWRKSKISKQSFGCQPYVNGGQGEFGGQQHVFRAGARISQQNQLPWTLTYCLFKPSTLLWGQERQREETRLHGKCHPRAHTHRRPKKKKKNKKKKKQKRKNPGLSKCFWLLFPVPDVAKTMFFLWIKSPLSRPSSQQPLNYITEHAHGLLWFSSEMVKGRRKWVVLGALYNNQ